MTMTRWSLHLVRREKLERWQFYWGLLTARKQMLHYRIDADCRKSTEHAILFTKGRGYSLELAHAYLELWMHAGSLESTTEALEWLESPRATLDLIIMKM